MDLHVLRVFSVYPKGNDKENGEGHLSLYIRVVDKLSAGSFVNVMFRFLIYDQIQDNYLVIQGKAPISFHVSLFFFTPLGVQRPLILCH